MVPTKEDVFQELIKTSFYWESEGVTNVGWLAQRLSTTKYHINKHLKPLLEEGLIARATRKGGYNDISDVPFPPIKGYTLTQKAKELLLYQKLKDEEERIFNQYWGIDQQTN